MRGHATSWWEVLRAAGFEVTNVVSADDLLERYSPGERALVDPSLYALTAAVPGSRRAKGRT
jgi:hypothetical protein